MAIASTMMPLGTTAPDFALPDVRTGNTVSVSEFEGRALVVMFICNHCPYVKHVSSGLARFGDDYADRDLAIVGISSNDIEAYPDDAPEELARVSDELGYPFPVLYDESQEVAHAYGAACTPDFFVFDAGHRLRYRGQFDDARPSSDAPVTGADVRAAVEALLAGEDVSPEQRPSLGCGIKWKPGNEPR